jgi:hypothetical protein
MMTGNRSQINKALYPKNCKLHWQCCGNHIWRQKEGCVKFTYRDSSQLQTWPTIAFVWGTYRYSSNYRRDQQKPASEAPTDTAATTDVIIRSLRQRYLPTQQQLHTWPPDAFFWDTYRHSSNYRRDRYSRRNLKIAELRRNSLLLICICCSLKPTVANLIKL